MSFERKRRRKVADINVGVKVDLPQAAAEQLSPESKPPLIASVDADGNYYVTFATSNDKTKRQLDEVTTIVAEQLKLEPDTLVMVKGDRLVPYQTVIDLMAALQEAGVPSVGLMTDNPK